MYFTVIKLHEEHDKDTTARHREIWLETQWNKSSLYALESWQNG